MRYRIVQRRIVELDQSKHYSEEYLELHRQLHPDESKVVWQGDRDKKFGENFLRNPAWHTDRDWPRTEWCGWVCYSYRLERFDAETQTWQYINHVEPVYEWDGLVDPAHWPPA